MWTAVWLLAAALMGCGGVLDSEVDPTLTDSVNPEVNPVVDVDAPISILGLGTGGSTTSALTGSSEPSGDL
jgi:hypothetical protein